jgi:hypothetical protein
MVAVLVELVKSGRFPSWCEEGDYDFFQRFQDEGFLFSQAQFFLDPREW